tara:strand:+ start:222 stop:668 length:447 start_codon:yes stop_codon:yes gene_type:complete
MAAQYKIYGTDEMYSGLTVDVGGYMYSTIGGALEGDSVQLVAGGGSNPNMNTNQIPNTQNNNPVTRTFVSRTTYYRQDGTTVPSGAELHQHQDGTIMLGHDPNNMGAVVTTINPNPPIGSGNGGSGNTTPGGPRNNRMNQGSGGGGSY